MNALRAIENKDLADHSFTEALLSRDTMVRLDGLGRAQGGLPPDTSLLSLDHCDDLHLVRSNCAYPHVGEMQHVRRFWLSLHKHTHASWPRSTQPATRSTSGPFSLPSEGLVKRMRGKGRKDFERQRQEIQGVPSLIATLTYKEGTELSRAMFPELVDAVREALEKFPAVARTRKTAGP